MNSEKKTVLVPGELYTDEVKDMALCQNAPTPETDDPEAPYLASDMYQRIVALINNFESELPDTMQAGGRLVSAGDITFSIQDIGYWDPNMIVFYGELSDGSAVELVQHLSQSPISQLLSPDRMTSKNPAGSSALPKKPNPTSYTMLKIKYYYERICL